jgi:hypothetical protein
MNMMSSSTDISGSKGTQSTGVNFNPMTIHEKISFVHFKDTYQDWDTCVEPITNGIPKINKKIELEQQKIYTPTRSFTTHFYINIVDAYKQLGIFVCLLSGVGEYEYL